MPLTNDFHAIYTAGKQNVSHHIIGMQAQKQVGINRIVIHLTALLRGQAREVRSTQLSILLVYAIWQAENLSKFNFYLDMHRFRPPSGISAASRDSAKQ